MYSEPVERLAAQARLDLLSIERTCGKPISGEGLQPPIRRLDEQALAKTGALFAKRIDRS